MQGQDLIRSSASPPCEAAGGCHYCGVVVCFVFDNSLVTQRDRGTLKDW